MPSTPKPETQDNVIVNVPTICVRVGQRPSTWGLPRRFSRYRITSPQERSIGGAAPKWLIAPKKGPFKVTDFYVAKGAKGGPIETYTELFINQLGQSLGFPMAHSGLVRLDGSLHFVSKTFFQSDDENLVPCSVMFQDHFEMKDLHGIPKGQGEQSFYSIDLVAEVVRNFCGEAFEKVLPRFLQMLVFDALVGSMDRHIENWGVIASNSSPRRIRFAPIFDSARSILWDWDDVRLERIGTLDGSGMLVPNMHSLMGYINRSRPLIGIAGQGSLINHFELLGHVLDNYGTLMEEPMRKVRTPAVRRRAAALLGAYPFCGVFSTLRTKLILKVLEIRADKLSELPLKKGACHGLA